MKKVILFDFDGTLADTLQLILEIVNKHLIADGYDPISQTELKKLREMNPLQLVAHFKFPIWKIPGIVKAVRSDLHKEVKRITIFPGIKKLIGDLRKNNFQLAVLSSNVPGTINEFIKLKHLPAFDYVKCEPNIFEKSKLIKKFLQEHSLSAKDVIYVGDEVRDIEACHSIGVPIISVTWGFNDTKSLRSLKPDGLVNKPREILKLVNET